MTPPRSASHWGGVAVDPASGAFARSTPAIGALPASPGLATQMGADELTAEAGAITATVEELTGQLNRQLPGDR